MLLKKGGLCQGGAYVRSPVNTGGYCHKNSISVLFPYFKNFSSFLRIFHYF